MKFPGLSHRITQRLLALGYRRQDGRPDVARFCRVKGWDPRGFYPYLKGRMPNEVQLPRLARDLETSVPWLLHGDQGVREVEPPERTHRRLEAVAARARAIMARMEQDLKELERIRATLGKARSRTSA